MPPENGPFRCGCCVHYQDKKDGSGCNQKEVVAELGKGKNGLAPVARDGCCNEFLPDKKPKGIGMRLMKLGSVVLFLVTLTHASIDGDLIAQKWNAGQIKHACTVEVATGDENADGSVSGNGMRQEVCPARAKLIPAEIPDGWYLQYEVPYGWIFKKVGAQAND
jgi:hypothetical protein